jgi:hypothetical protein
MRLLIQQSRQQGELGRPAGTLEPIAPRVLLICAALLLGITPITAVAQPTALAVERVWTQDPGGKDQSTFVPGEPIQFAAQLNNSYGGALLSAEQIIATSPSFFSNDRKVDIPAGISTWTWNATAPSTLGNYTVTVQTFDRFYGRWATGNGTFTVVPQPSFCPSPVVSFNTIAASIGMKSTINGHGWVPGGTVSITLPYGSKALFYMSSITPQVSSTGDWQVEMTVGQGTPVDEYIINFDEQIPGCPLGIYPTFTVEENPPLQGGAFGAVVRCQDAPFVFPVPARDENGNTSFIGWLYKEDTRGWPNTPPDTSIYHSGLDFWASTGTPVMAQATGIVSQVENGGSGTLKPTIKYSNVTYVDKNSKQTGDVYVYTDNLIGGKIGNDQINVPKANDSVWPGQIIGLIGKAYTDEGDEQHVHWSVSQKVGKDQSTDWNPATTPHLDPTSFLTPKGNLNYETGARRPDNNNWSKTSLSWWCTGG